MKFLNYYDEIKSIRSLIPFDIDGIVIKVNSFEEQNQIGSIARSPRYAFAENFLLKKAKLKF